MAGPITWRNVESDPTRGAAVLFESARRALNDGFTGFNGIIDSRNEVNQQNWDTQKEVNTDQFLDRLAQYKTPEELAAAQEAGQLQALKAQFGGQIDRDAVRGAEAAQADVLMKRIAAQNQYGDDKINRDARPLMEQYQGLLAKKDTAGAAKFLADNRLAVDESGALKDLQSLEKTLFSQDIDRGQLAVSQGTLGLAQQRAAQSTTLFNQNQAEYARNEKNRVALESGNELTTTMATQIGQSYMDSASIPTETVESARTQLKNELTKNGTPPDVIEQLVTNFDSKVKSAHSLGAQGQGLESAVKSPIDLAHKVQLDRLESAYKSEVEKNPLVSTDVVDPEATMDKLMKEVDPDGAWNGSEYKDLVTSGKGLLGQPINIGTADKPEYIKVTQGMVKEALKTVNSSWGYDNAFKEGAALENAIKDMVKGDGFAGRYRDAQLVHQNYVQQVSGENSAHTTATNEAVNKLRKELFPNR